MRPAGWWESPQLTMNARTPSKGRALRCQSGTWEDDVTRGLLSDARYLATWQEPPNLQRALLLAAVACEVQAKRVLQRKASPPRDPRGVAVHESTILSLLGARSLRSDRRATHRPVTQPRRP